MPPDYCDGGAYQILTGDRVRNKTSMLHDDLMCDKDIGIDGNRNELRDADLEYELDGVKCASCSTVDMCKHKCNTCGGCIGFTFTSSGCTLVPDLRKYGVVLTLLNVNSQEEVESNSLRKFMYVNTRSSLCYARQPAAASPENLNLLIDGVSAPFSMDDSTGAANMFMQSQGADCSARQLVTKTQIN